MNRGFDLTGKIAVVTGSTSGIGIGIAQVLACNGAHVVITGRRKERGEAVAKEIRDGGCSASYHSLDITDENSVQVLIEDTVKEYGKIDILVNNAANVNAKDGMVTDLSSEDWDTMLASDLKSVFLVCKYTIPHMKQNGGGSIINTGSTAGVSGNYGWSAYGPAKAGVINLTQNIAFQYGKDNIRCNCVHPGLIVTPQNEAGIPQFFKDIYMDEIDVNRYGCPKDIGYAVLFFASDEASFVTGQSICIDGGMMSHAPMYSKLRKAAEQN